MEKKLIEVFETAVLQTFLKVIDVDLTLVNKNENGDILYDISGVIGFIGDIVGSVVLRIPESTAQEIRNRMIKKRTIQSENILDTVSELVSMVAGNMITAFDVEKKSLSIPQTIRGKDHEIDFKGYKEKVELYFTSDIGVVCLVVAYGLNSDDKKIV